jgi:uncharacterized membrane protein YecN with MAPEG domain
VTVPFVVPAYAGLLALIYVFLALRVSRMRGAARAMIGTGGNPRLERAIRAHANCAEYVPFALLLLGFMELQRNSSYLLHLLCLMLVAGRVIHALNISRADESIAVRFVGTLLTQAVMIIAAITLIVDYFRVASL